MSFVVIHLWGIPRLLVCDRNREADRLPFPGFVGGGEQSGFCSGPNGHYEGPLANGAPYDIADGVQEGDQISFKSELCTYQGALSADGEPITGTARCAYTQAGVNFVWTGDWLGNRGR